MSCPLITKVKDDLISKGIYNEDTFEISNLERFDKINKSWSDIARKDYNVTNTDDMFNIVKQEVKMLSGHSYLRNNIKTVWKGFPNLDFFKEFQEKYDKIKSNKPKVNKVSIQQYIKPGVAELFEQNPELANAVYSKILTNSGLSAENLLSLLEKENIVEKDCSGKLKAEKGLQTNFTKNGEWKIIKDLKGYPTHKEGGVDLTIGKNGVSIKNGNTEFTAKQGLVIPKN